MQQAPETLPPATPDAQSLKLALVPLRERLLAHPIYGQLDDARCLRHFMETHVFAVWDFQSLLKALQRHLTCVELPWVPVGSGAVRRLVNEIVLAEESDEAPGGEYLSHFELYLAAMRECGAETEPILSFVDRVRRGVQVGAALADPSVPPSVAAFCETTMAIATSGARHRIAAAFAYGREEVIPSMFLRFVERLAAASPASWSTLRFYLERHIGVDADEHGPMAKRLVESLCGDDPRLWAEATEAAAASLRARLRLWDGVVAGSNA